MVPDTPETVPEMQDTPPCLCPEKRLNGGAFASPLFSHLSMCLVTVD